MDALNQETLAEFDKLPLECDGLTLVLHEYLIEQRVPHTVLRGHLERTDGGGPKTWNLFGILTPAATTVYHVWISLGENRFLDMRARMWFGHDAPHGVFRPDDFPNFVYSEISPKLLASRGG